MTRLCRALGAAALFLPSAALAQSESRLSADASVTAGYQNNPFTVLGSDTGSGVVTIDVTPQYRRLTQRSTITVSADANLQQYLRRYGHNESYSGALDYQGRPAERLNTHARLDLSSSVLGAFGGYAPVVTTTGIGTADGTGIATGAATTVAAATATNVVTPIVSPLVPITDVGLFGLRNRRRSARLSGDAGLGVSARDTLTVSAYGEIARYHNLIAGDYEAYGASVGYSRRVSDRATVGLRGSVSAYDYRTGIANTQAYSVAVTGSDQINARWSVDGSLGVSFVGGGNAYSTSSTSLSGNIDLCRRGERSTLCAQAARQVSPTGFAGSQYVTSLGANWTRRVGERQSVTLSGNYSEVGGGGSTQLVTGALPVIVPAVQTQYAQATAGYNRQLRQRLRFIASADYRQLFGGGFGGRPKDFGGQVGLSYRFGDNR